MAQCTHCQGKTGNVAKNKGKRYFKICHENFQIFFEALSLPSFVYVIVINHINWPRENLQSGKENTGNLKMQFEWAPWCL